MKTIVLVALLALPLAGHAQSVQKPETGAPAAGAAPGTPAASPQYGQGGSPHCDSLSGTQRDQCLKDEGAKTDSKGPSHPSASGSSAAAPKTPEKGKKDPY